MSQVQASALPKCLEQSLRNLRLINNHESTARLLGLALVHIKADDAAPGGLLSESRRVEHDAIRDRLTECLRPKDQLLELEDSYFALVYKSIDSAAHLELAATKLERSLQAPLCVLGERLTIKPHAGLVSGTDREAPPRLIKRAMSALRAAEAGGRCVAFATKVEEQQTDQRALEAELEAALYEGEFVPYFQPKLHGAYHNVTGAEALVRWHSPKRGLVPPGAFLPVLESSRLIEPFTHRLLRTVLSHARLWPEKVSVAVNIPASMLGESYLKLAIEDALNLFAITPKRLVIEITENSFVHDMETSRKHLQALREVGVQISIDDFGTGYSSLAYLRDLPADELKLDRSFIRNLTTDAKDHVLVSGVVSLAQRLGFKVVAEGVEDKETAAALKALGCDTVQGFYFAKPMPPEQFLKWLRERIGS